MLRQFKTVDRWQLTSLIQSDNLPSIADISRKLGASVEEVPRGVSVQYLAETIHDALTRSDATTVSGGLCTQDILDLAAIPTGKKAATRYQKKVMHIINHLFDTTLLLIGKEVNQHSGRKRIDIAYQNNANEGFFSDLQTRHGIKCPIIPTECKNYTDDVANPEFDQLAGRLTDKVGKFGILACRTKKDAQLIAARALDLANGEKKFILVLTDDDLRELVDLKLSGDEEGIDAFMQERLRALVLN